MSLREIFEEIRMLGILLNRYHFCYLIYAHAEDDEDSNDGERFVDWLRAAMVECNRLASVNDTSVDQPDFQFIYAYCLLRYGEISIDIDESIEDNLIDFFRASRDFSQPWVLQNAVDAGAHLRDFQLIFIKSLLYLAYMDSEEDADQFHYLIDRTIPIDLDLLVKIVECICGLKRNSSVAEHTAAIIVQKLDKILTDDPGRVESRKAMAEILLWQSSGRIEELEMAEEIDDESSPYKELVSKLEQCISILKLIDNLHDNPYIQLLLCEANLHLADWIFDENASEMYLRNARTHAKLCASLDPIMLPSDIKEILLK